MSENVSSRSFNKKTDVKCCTKCLNEKWNISWTIENFGSSEKSCGESIVSQTFQAGFSPENKWYLSVFPKGVSTNWSNHASVYLTSKCQTNVICKFNLAIKNGKGEKIYAQSKSQTFTSGARHGYECFIQHSNLYNDEEQILINNSLTIICELVIFGPTEDYISSCGYNSKLHLLSNDFKELYNSSKFSDVTLLIGDKKINAHKAVLAARSSVFAAMFEHPMEESKSDVVNITDIEYNVMDELLRYIYTGQCPRLEDMAADLLPAADKYDLAGLKLMTEECLATQLTVYNTALTLCIADTYNAELLKEKALEFLNSHGKEVMNTSGWNSVVARPQLVIDAFTAIFDHCVVYKRNIELKT